MREVQGTFTLLRPGEFDPEDPPEVEPPDDEITVVFSYSPDAERLDIVSVSCGITKGVELTFSEEREILLYAEEKARSEYHLQEEQLGYYEDRQERERERAEWMTDKHTL
jgi:hypothetical protein